MSDATFADPNAAGLQALSDDELRSQLRAARQEMKRRGLVPAKKAARGAGRKTGRKAGGKAGGGGKAARRAKRRAAAGGDAA